MFGPPNSESGPFKLSPFLAILNSREVAWGLIIIYFLGAFTFSWLGLARFVNLLYPASAFVLGVFLYFRFPGLYLGFTWWVWFISPLVRRFVDFRSTFTDPSPVLVAPYLVTLMTFYTVIKYLPRTFRTEGLPYFISLSSIIFTLFLGLINHPTAKVLEQFLALALPLTFGFHLYINWQHYPAYRDSFKRVFLWGVFIMGLYGVVQFCTAPEWDIQWLLNSDYQSGGRPQPFKLRVWSTLNSAGPFASVMMSGLLLMLDEVGKLRGPASLLGFLSFLLSQHRSSWLSWAFGFLNIAGASRPQKQIRLIISMGLLVLLVLGLAGLDQFSGIISDRFESFLSLEDDGSGLARQAEYAEFLVPALSQIVGYGLGGLGHDSGILFFLLNFGWIGTVLYFGGLCLPIVRIYQSTYVRRDDFLIVSRAIVLCILIQMPTVIATQGPQGMILWSCVSLGLAAERYYSNHEKIEALRLIGE